MIEEIRYTKNNSEIEENLRDAMIKQMAMGYQEMGELNLQITSEDHHLSSEAMFTQDKILEELNNVK